MHCQDIYSTYQNKVVEIEFKPESESYKKYRSNLVGSFFYPSSTGAPFYGDIKINENLTYQHQLLRLAFVLRPGFIGKYQISGEMQKQLMDEGFPCSDIQKITSSNDVSLFVSGFLNNNEITYGVSGAWSYNQQASAISFFENGQIKTKLSGNDFYSFCNEIRGCLPAQVPNILNKYKLNLNEIGISVDLLKALCNIFIWLEYYFVEGDIAPDPNKMVNNSEFLPKMYDEFIIDYSSNTEAQKEIYLIKQQYRFGDAISLLDELVRLNLLCKVVLKVQLNEYPNYFIPFTKADYTFLLNERRDLYALYNAIVNDRNVCLNNFFNNR